MTARIVALLLLLQASAGAQDRPNINFCVSDDQSWGDTGTDDVPVVKIPAFAVERMTDVVPEGKALLAGPSEPQIIYIYSIEPSRRPWGSPGEPGRFGSVQHKRPGSRFKT